jgi:hypothetical protein
MNVPVQEQSKFIFLFALFEVWMDYIMSTYLGSGGSSLTSLQIEMLFPYGNIHTDRPRNNVLPVVWTSFKSVKLTDKINHHDYPLHENKTV